MKLPEGYTFGTPSITLKTKRTPDSTLKFVRKRIQGDGSLIRSALQDVTRSQNMSGLARQVGMSRAGLYKTLSPNGNPSFATIMRLTRALGMQVVIRPLPIEKSPHPDSEEGDLARQPRDPTTQAKSPVG